MTKEEIESHKRYFLNKLDIYNKSIQILKNQSVQNENIKKRIEKYEKNILYINSESDKIK